MTQIVIDKKKYVVVPQAEYDNLRKRAALKIKPEKLLSLNEARLLSKGLIEKWAKDK